MKKEGNVTCSSLVEMVLCYFVTRLTCPFNSMVTNILTYVDADNTKQFNKSFETTSMPKKTQSLLTSNHQTLNSYR